MNDGAAGSSPVRRVSMKEHAMFSKVETPHGWLVAFPRFEKALQLLHKSRKYIDADWTRLDGDLAGFIFGIIAGLGPRKNQTPVVYGEHFTAVKGVNRRNRNRFGGVSNLSPLSSSAQFSKRQKDAMAQRQKPDRCEACDREHPKICWDHCHAVGSFRGWICSDCNSALGFAGDSVDRLNKLAAYLDRAKQAPR